MIEMCLRIGIKHTIIHPKNDKSKKEIDEKNKIRWCCFQTKLWPQHAVQNRHVNPRIIGFFTTWHPRPAGISDVSWTLKDFLNNNLDTPPPKMEKYDNNKPKNKRINAIINQCY